ARVLFGEQGTQVLLEVESAFPQNVDGLVRIEFIDTSGVLRARAESGALIKTGRNTLTIPIAVSLNGKAATDTRELLWYRLRYSVSPARTSEFAPVRGVVSLSEITPDIFALRVASSRKAQEGS